LASFYTYRGELEKGAEVGRQILLLADAQDDPSIQIEGHLVLGSSLGYDVISVVLEDSAVPNGAYLDEKGPARRSTLALSDEDARRWEAWTRTVLHPWL
jgi:hypothetical protein